jgi:hypothetical protein
MCVTSCSIDRKSVDGCCIGSHGLHSTTSTETDSSISMPLKMTSSAWDRISLRPFTDCTISGTGSWRDKDVNSERLLDEGLDS